MAQLEAKDRVLMLADERSVADPIQWPFPMQSSLASLVYLAMMSFAAP